MPAVPSLQPVPFPPPEADAPSLAFSPGSSWLRRGIVAILALLVLADTTNRLGIMLVRDDLFAGDAAQHTWWMYRYADPSLFPNDLAARYYAQYVYSPPGYQLIFKLLAPMVDAQRLSEGIAIALNLIGVALAALLGRRIGGFGGGAAAVFVWVLAQSAMLVEGGFPRSFGLPLMLAGMLAIVAGRWIAFGVVMIAVTLLYPPIVLNLAPVAGGVLLIGSLRTRKLPRGFAGLCICGVIAVAIVALLYVRPPVAESGRFVTYGEAKQMPEWGRDGRTAFFKSWTAFYFQNATSGIGLTLPATVVAVAALGVTALLRRRAISLEAWLLITSAVVIWALAHVVAFKLYLPSRYMTYAVPTFAMMWAAGLAATCRSRAPAPSPHGGEGWGEGEKLECRAANDCLSASAKLASHPNPLPHGEREPDHVRGARMARALATISFAAICAFVIIRSTRQAITTFRGPASWDPPPGFMQAMSVLRSMPVDTVIASHPYDARSIPLLSHRSVLVNHEVAIPFNVTYYAAMKRRIEATFDMLYATDWRTIDAIADREGVQVFLLDRRRLLQPGAKENAYKQPFESQNMAKIDRGYLVEGFAMLNAPADRVLLTVDDLELIAVGSRSSRP